MGSTRPVFMARASSAFSSLAVTVVMAVVTILALALGAVQDSKAETSSDPALLGLAKVEDPALEWGNVKTAALPVRPATAEKPQVLSRRPLSMGPAVTVSRGPQGPAQEWMGMSKLAIPLLVGDLVGGREAPAPRVMTGRSVGVVK